MSTVTNPLGSVVDGMLQAYSLHHAMQRQADEHQAFLTNQALHNQQMSVQDIMNEEALVGRGARPVQNGMVEEPGSTVPAMQSPEPGVMTPGSQPVGGILRKAGGNGRFVATLKNSQGQSKQYEMPTPEEQQQLATSRELQSKTQLMRGEATAQQDITMELRRRVLSTPGLTVAAPAGLEVLGYPQGSPIPKGELPGLIEAYQKIRNGDQFTLKPGESRLSQGSILPGAAQPQAPQYAPNEFQDLQQAGGGAPAAAPAPAAPGSSAGSSAPRVIASGGPPVPTGEFGTVYLPKFAASLGKKPADLDISEVEKALSQFKQANADPEIREATLASKASANATRDLANTMKQIQLGQMPTQEDAARMAEQIRNHELAPSQLSEIRGRGNGSLGTMIEREIHKTDPHFNWAQADADYNYSKSPGLQNTVRLMDSALNSIPRMQDAANKLAQGNVRSINSLVKLGKNQFNSVDLKRFQTDATLVGDEIGKIIQGGGTGSGVSDAKLTQAQNLLKDTDSPKAIATALEEVQAIIGYRRQAVTRGTYLENRTAPAEGAATAPAAAGAGTGTRPPLSSFEAK